MRHFALPLIAALAAPAAAAADEGMWPLDQIPAERLQRLHGFAPDPGWLERVRLASTRVGRASGAFVSAEGLVLTNHHVAADCIQKLSHEGEDLFAEGFLARSREEERRCPDLEIDVLLEVEDVTDRIEAAAAKAATEAEAYVARRDAMAAAESECATDARVRCDVITFHEGGAYGLHRYRRHTDVRLVWAPEAAIAYFGGDQENFTYPRHDLDAALLRVWDGGQPLKPESWLEVDPAGAAEGDLVFVSGHPGQTTRARTVAQLELLRDHQLPLMLRAWREQAARLRAFGKTSSENGRLATKEIIGLENGIKGRAGMLAGLRDKSLMARKRKQEAALQAALAARPETAAASEGFRRIAGANRAFAGYVKDYLLLERPLALPGRLFAAARMLIRRTDEAAKPSGERLREYGDARLPEIDRALFSPAPLYPALEIERLAWGFEFLRRELGPGHPLVKAILGGREPRKAAEAWVSGSSLFDLEERRALARLSPAELKASKDPMIQLALLVDPEARRLRQRMEDEVASVEQSSGGAIARSLFALQGKDRCPDATGTLRLSWGLAKGYREKGRRVPWATTVGGLFAHATGMPPLALPRRWLAARPKLDPTTPLNYVSTADIVGGNSGSPAIGRGGKLVGLVFDGNLQSLPNDFLYSEEQARAVSVHPRALLEALGKVYEAPWLVEELSPGAR